MGPVSNFVFKLKLFSSSSTTNGDCTKCCAFSIFKIIGLFSCLIPLFPTHCHGTYREHFVHSEKICPNPLHSHSVDNFPRKTLLVNLPKTLSLFGTQVNDFPCNFASSTGGGIPKKKVIVRAIHPSVQSWDFSTSQTCDYFIKFKRGDSGHNTARGDSSSNKEEVICRVWKQHAFHQGSFFHPMMWNSPNSKMTLSFSTYNWEYRLENNDTILYKPVYLQMVFLVYGDNENYCSLRIQQYLIDPLENINTNCSNTTFREYQHCGQYECSKAKSLLSSMGFRTYEIDDVELTRNRPLRPDGESSDEDEDEDEEDGRRNSDNSHVTEETDRSVSTVEHYDIFKTTTRTITFSNNSNSIMSHFHRYAVGSIILVPIIVLIVAVLGIRCYIRRCQKSHYDSRESLIVPLERAMMNTHVNMHGIVELEGGGGIPLYRSSWMRNNSMDYIQPIDLRNSPLSNAPSYEKFGPPRYSDAVVI